MKWTIITILSVAAIPMPKYDPECIGSPDQVEGARMAFQDPKRSCNHNHLLAHIGLQRDAGVNSAFPGTPLFPKPTNPKAYQQNGGLGPVPSRSQMNQIIGNYM